MGKKLSEMSLEELWQLFPIFLTAPDPKWKAQYAREAASLRRVLPKDAQIFHIGSTAIDGIWAKPIVDILIEVGDGCDLPKIAQAIVSAGYIVMSQTAERISLNKGYTEQGFADEVFHVHLQHTSDKNEVLFRDYLNAHPDVAKEYETLKSTLAKIYAHDRDGYTQAKSAFVEKYTDMAKRESNP